MPSQLPVIPPFTTLIHQARDYVTQHLRARGTVQAAYLTNLDCPEGQLPCWQVDVFFAGRARGITLELRLQPDGSVTISPLAEGSTLPSAERLVAAQHRHAQLQAGAQVFRA